MTRKLSDEQKRNQLLDKFAESIEKEEFTEAEILKAQSLAPPIDEEMRAEARELRRSLHERI